MEAEWKANNQERGADLNPVDRAQQVRGCERAVGHHLGQSSAFDFDRRHVDLSSHIETLAPNALTIAVQGDRESDGLGHVIRVRVHLDLNTIREVLARLVDHHVSTCHQEQTLSTFEEKATSIRQQLLLFEQLEGKLPRSATATRRIRFASSSMTGLRP